MKISFLVFSSDIAPTSASYTNKKSMTSWYLLLQEIEEYFTNIKYIITGSRKVKKDLNYDTQHSGI